MLGIIAQERPIRLAAVLTVVDHPQPTVLLTQRLPISTITPAILPGGKIDASPLDAAAWAEEEVGLAAALSIRSAISTRMAQHGCILPTARVKPGFSLRVNHAEVDDALRYRYRS